MLDRTLINLNNGNSCPSPTVVHDALKRYLDFSNQAPVYTAGSSNRTRETARRRLAAEFGCDTEELAITRNSSEALQIAQNGIDLKPGDEVLTTEQDYGRMLTTWDQRARRDGIKITQINFPVPTTQDDLLSALREGDHAADQGAALLPHHEPDRTALPGEAAVADGAPARHPHHRRRRARVRALPVQGRRSRVRLLRHEPAQVAAGAAQHRVPLRPARAHRADLAADGRASAADQRHPQVRGGRARFRPRRLPPSTRRSRSTRPSASSARPRDLRYLTMRWVNRLKQNPRIQIHSDLEHTYGLALVGIQGIKAADINRFLWDKYRIITTAITRDDYQGIRVTPNIYTTLEEIDTFVMAMEDLLKNGVPATTA